jgi:hypothetical protein
LLSEPDGDINTAPAGTAYDDDGTTEPDPDKPATDDTPDNPDVALALAALENSAPDSKLPDAAHTTTARAARRRTVRRPKKLARIFADAVTDA